MKQSELEPSFCSVDVWSRLSTHIPSLTWIGSSKMAMNWAWRRDSCSGPFAASGNLTVLGARLVANYKLALGVFVSVGVQFPAFQPTPDREDRLSRQEFRRELQPPMWRESGLGCGAKRWRKKGWGRSVWSRQPGEGQQSWSPPLPWMIAWRKSNRRKRLRKQQWNFPPGLLGPCSASPSRTQCARPVLLLSNGSILWGKPWVASRLTDTPCGAQQLGIDKSYWVEAKAKRKSWEIILWTMELLEFSKGSGKPLIRV